MVLKLSLLPRFLKAVCGPLTVIILLALRSLFKITIDSLIALPMGGFVCIIVTGKIKESLSIIEFGLSKVVGVSILLKKRGNYESYCSNRY